MNRKICMNRNERSRAIILLCAGVLSACVDDSLVEDSEASSEALTGNLLANPSFETSTASWLSWQGTVTRIALAGAPDGGFVARVARATGNAYSLDDSVVPVASSPTGASYRSSVFVRAASASAVGKPIVLVIRERTSTGGFVKEWSSAPSALTNSFVQLDASAAPAAGHQLDVYVSQANAVAGDAFYADNISLTKNGGSPPPPPPPPGLTLAAFPEAQGGGAMSLGGRGGAVHRVTSLADSGPGTLRDCAEVKSGPRTCVFAVGGTIELKTGLWITHPNLTVAGQTAPGGGIQITHAPGAVIPNLVGIATNNIVWRYTKFRHRYVTACSDAGASECGALFTTFSGSRDVIADHNSLSWNQDEGYGIWNGDSKGIGNLTFSQSLIAEGLASHSTGVIVGGSNSALAANVTDVDMHHNLIMNNGHRNPLMKNKSGRVINNIFYNQYFYINQMLGGGLFDVIGNFYKKGPMNHTAHEVQLAQASGTDALDGAPSLYIASNVGWSQSSASGEQWSFVARVTGENGTEIGAAPTTWRRMSPLPATPRPITVESVDRINGATGSILPIVGASRRLDCTGAWVENRDSVDSRLVQQYLTNTGIANRVVNESSVGGLPSVSSGPACTDADGDGMPDAWEAAHGLSSTDANDRNTKRIGAAGYTNLELYLSGLFPNGTPLP